MRGINWDKVNRDASLRKRRQTIREEKEQTRISKMIQLDNEPATIKQKEYVQSILKCTLQDLSELTINKARRIIGEYENISPATQKQKDAIRRKKLLIESKIDTLTVKEAKKIISAEEFRRKSAENKKAVAKKNKFIKSKKFLNKNRAKR